jgi:hypothetical protein
MGISDWRNISKLVKVTTLYESRNTKINQTKYILKNGFRNEM